MARLQLPTSNILPQASANYFPQVLLLSFCLKIISANRFTPAYYSCLVFFLIFYHKILLNLDKCPPKRQLKCFPCHLKFSFDLENVTIYCVFPPLCVFKCLLMIGYLGWWLFYNVFFCYGGSYWFSCMEMSQFITTLTTSSFQTVDRPSI